MKPNKNHISLKTAKLLKDCGVESKEIFVLSKSAYDDKPLSAYITNSKYKNKIKFYKKRKKINFENYSFTAIGKIDYEIISEIYPAYTWQEIEDNAEVFFGKKMVSYGEDANEMYPRVIKEYIQQKKYEDVDDYFREHTILISIK